MCFLRHFFQTEFVRNSLKIKAIITIDLQILKCATANMINKYLFVYNFSIYHRGYQLLSFFYCFLNGNLLYSMSHSNLVVTCVECTPTNDTCHMYIEEYFPPKIWVKFNLVCKKNIQQNLIFVKILGTKWAIFNLLEQIFVYLKVSWTKKSICCTRRDQNTMIDWQWQRLKLILNIICRLFISSRIQRALSLFTQTMDKCQSLKHIHGNMHSACIWMDVPRVINLWSW